MPSKSAIHTSTSAASARSFSRTPLCPSAAANARELVASDTTEYLNNASKVLPVSINLAVPEHHRYEQLVRVAKTLCPFLAAKQDKACRKPADPEDVRISDSADGRHQSALEVRSLSGGLSNSLFVVSSPSRSVLVRVHPAAGMIVDHEEENRVLAWLSRLGKAPMFYGRFINGRVEELYDGFLPFSSQDMVKHVSPVAKMLAGLHTLSVPAEVLPPTATGLVWSRVEAWFQQALLREGRDAPPDHDMFPDLTYMHQQWTWLRTQLTAPSSQPAVVFARQVVFSHMDGQSLNILKNSRTGDMKFIDFEYAGMHPRAADIANTFCEFCDMNNLKADWEKEYPSDAHQVEFLDAYLAQCRVEHMDKRARKHIQKEINKHTLVSHLGWAMWSIQQNHYSRIDFDYLAYARHRMEGYHWFKDKFWSNAPVL